MDSQPLPSSPSPAASSRTSRLGLPFWAVIVLALLAAPRVVLHDLGLISGGTFVNAVLVFVPPLVWITVVLWRRTPRPLVTLIVVGAVYGLALALGHQIFWAQQFDGQPPRLGGNLIALDPIVESIILRFFAFVSSLITGTLVGLVTGLIAWGLHSLRGSRTPATCIT